MKRLIILAVAVAALFLGFYVTNQRSGKLVPLSEKLQIEMTQQIARGITEGLEFHLEGLPDAGDQAIVIVSISDGQDAANMYIGKGSGWESAIGEVLRSVPADKGQATKWIKVDFVTEILPPLPIGKKMSRVTVPYERSLVGLGVFDMDGPLFIPELITARTLINSKSKIRPSNIEKYLSLAEQEKFRGVQRLALFRTSAYAWIEGVVHKLYRGNRVQPAALSPEYLTEALKSAETYLVKEIQQDGSYTYTYLPKTDGKKSSYNILRHAGTTWSLLQLYEKFKNKETLVRIRSAMEFLFRNTVDCPNTQVEAKCLLERGSVKVGANGLALLALAKYTQVTGDKQYLDRMHGYAKRLEEIQDPSGEFKRHKESFPGGVDSNFVSGYYPGEAVFGLMALYELDQDERWMKVAAAAADWLINVRDKGKSIDKLDHDHWLLYGLNELQKHNPQPHYLEQSKRIVTAILQAQNDGSKFPDYDGSWYDPPRSTPAATRVEGLMAAYQLFVRAGDENMAKQIIEASKRSLRYQLATQIMPESALYLPNPQRALGGFRASFTNYEVRIDYVQHNASAIIYYLDATSRTSH